MKIPKYQMATEKEGLLGLAMLLCSTGAALASSNLPAGIVCIIGGVAVIFLRGYFKLNGRWK